MVSKCHESYCQEIFHVYDHYHEMWKALHEAYGDEGNESHLFYLKSKVWDLKQGSLSLGDYYLAKSTLWQEIDLVHQDTPFVPQILMFIALVWRKKDCLSYWLV